MQHGSHPGLVESSCKPGPEQQLNDEGEDEDDLEQGQREL